MLIELWERLRGFDKWTQTQAKIKSSNLAEVEIGKIPTSILGSWGSFEAIVEWQSTCLVTWTEASGKSHEAEFKVAENSPLFQLYDGQTVTIRYNPANPDQFHLRGLLGSRFHTWINRVYIFFANPAGRG
jgi:hypothetical protein